MKFNLFKKKISKSENVVIKKNYWLDNFKTFFIAILIALTLRTFAFEPFSIPSGSMKPTLLEGDYLFVSKYSFGYSKHSFPMSFPGFSGRVFGKYPKRGDVAVFKFTQNTRIDYIKRIVGLPGDTVQVKDGILYLNNTAVDRKLKGPWRAKDRNNIMQTYTRYEENLSDNFIYDVLDATPNGMLDNTDIYTVPAGHIFAMGDNRDQSSDSRILSQLGFIPFDHLVGKAQIIFYSRDRSESIWKLWLWPSSVRLERIFKKI
jgi:signal peptidase I